MKDKAKELYHKFLTCQPDMHLAKQCALICCDELIDSVPRNIKHFEHLKKEIEKL